MFHFHSSTMPGTAFRMTARTRRRVSPRQSSSSAILAVIDSDAVSPFGRAGDLFKTASFQAVRCPLRRLAAYGSTNRYRPVNSSRASGSSGE